MIRRMRTGDVTWSILLRPHAPGEATDHDLWGVSLEGHVLRTRADGTDPRSVAEALERARSLQWVDPNGLAWTFTLDPSTYDRATVHVHLGEIWMGSIPADGAFSLAALTGEHFYELLFELEGRRRASLRALERERRPAPASARRAKVVVGRRRARSRRAPSALHPEAGL